MNQQEFVSRVGDLATRIGYPIPSVDWSADEKYRDRGIVLDPRSTFGPTLHVHQCVEHSMPPGVQDLLIAQEFVQTRLGVWRQRQRVRWVVAALTGVCGFAWVVAMSGTIDSYVVNFLLGVPIVTVLSNGVQIGIVAVWSRWFMRRADRQLVAVLGREQVVSGLGWWVEIGWRPSVRWVLNGATPTAKERLRRLNTSIAD